MSGPADDLADVFASVPVVAPDPTRRDSTLRATSGVLRRGRWLRRGLVGGFAVTLFIAGGVVGWVVKPTAPPVLVPSTEPPNGPPPIPPVAPTEPLSAVRLELLAELADEPAEAARLYREAGDRFLADRDYENAARCYRRHLTAADADGRQLSASDSWMLQTMKTPVR